MGKKVHGRVTLIDKPDYWEVKLGKVSHEMKELLKRDKFTLLITSDKVPEEVGDVPSEKLEGWEVVASLDGYTESGTVVGASHDEFGLSIRVVADEPY